MKISTIVEIPQGSYLKYEVDKESTQLSLALDRVLNQPVPYNYGYAIDTMCDDGDPLDVFILGNDSIHPLTKVQVDIVGILKCRDNDRQDDKLIAVISGDTNTPPTLGLDIIRRYLETYKTGFIIQSYGGAEEAEQVYLSTSKRSDK